MLIYIGLFIIIVGLTGGIVNECDVKHDFMEINE